MGVMCSGDAGRAQSQGPRRWPLGAGKGQTEDSLLELLGTWLGSSVSENETHEHGEILTRLFTSAEGRRCSKSEHKEEKTLSIDP